MWDDMMCWCPDTCPPRLLHCSLQPSSSCTHFKTWTLWAFLLAFTPKFHRFANIFDFLGPWDHKISKKGDYLIKNGPLLPIVISNKWVSFNIITPTVIHDPFCSQNIITEQNKIIFQVCVLLTDICNFRVAFAYEKLC